MSQIAEISPRSYSLKYARLITTWFHLTFALHFNRGLVIYKRMAAHSLLVAFYDGEILLYFDDFSMFRNSCFGLFTYCTTVIAGSKSTSRAAGR